VRTVRGLPQPTDVLAEEMAARRSPLPVDPAAVERMCRYFAPRAETLRRDDAVYVRAPSGTPTRQIMLTPAPAGWAVRLDCPRSDGGLVGPIDEQALAWLLCWVQGCPSETLDPKGDGERPASTTAAWLRWLADHGARGLAAEPARSA
jgi:hypothetical protein